MNKASFSVVDIITGLELDAIVLESKKPIAHTERASRVFAPAEFGQRNARAAQLAGHLYSRNMSLDTAVEVLELWNQANPEPMEADELRGVCESILRTRQRGAGSAANQAEYAPLTPLFDLSTASVGRFLDKEAPAQQWLLQDCFPLGKLGLIIASGGTGKSQLMLQAAIGVATGENVLAWRVAESGPVLALFAEDDEDEIHRRLRKCVDAMCLGRHDTVEFFQRLRTNLHVMSMVAEGNLMTTARGTGEVEATNYVDRLLLAIKGLNPKLIIIDPASRFRGGDENKAEDSTRFVEALERVPKETGASVLVAHHVRKGTGVKSNQEASRGSSALTDGMRWQMNLNSFDASDAARYGLPADQSRLYLQAEITKNNYAAPQPPVHLKRGDGGYLHAVQLTTSKEQKADTVAQKIIDLIRSETEQIRRYSKTSFEDKFGGADGPLEMGKTAVRKLLSEMIAAGRLVQQGKYLVVWSPVAKAKLDAQSPTS
jgi:RecA-family ATPase